MAAGGSDLSWQTQRVDGGTIFPSSGARRGRPDRRALRFRRVLAGSDGQRYGLRRDDGSDADPEGRRREPRRTIRIGLWGGEEQGLLGSRAYVREHLGDPATMALKPAHGKVSAYFNSDNGTGRIRGIWLQGNLRRRDPAAAVFAYNAAMRDERLPRKAPPPQGGAETGGDR